MKRSILILLTVALGSWVVPPAKTAEGPTARDHYFEAARTSDLEWIGIRTSILLRHGSRNSASLRETGEGADFHSGDQFRLRLQANDDGYAYLVLQSPNGDFQVLYPGRDAKPRSNRVRAFEDRLLPGRTKEWMTFDNKPAIEGLYVVFSPDPLVELERAIGGSERLSQADFDALLSANGRTRSMLFDEPEDEESGIIPATFYVEKRASGHKFLVRKMDLVHRNAPRQKDTDQ